MANHLILEEAKNLIERIDDYNKKIEVISRENALMKGLIVEKNKKLLENQQKIEELTRLLVMADKMLSEMKEKLYTKEEKTNRLSKKLSTIADGQDKTLNDMKKIIDTRNEQIKNLLRERTLLQSRLTSIINAYSQARKRSNELNSKIEEMSKKISSVEDKKTIETLKNLLERQKSETANFSKSFSEMESKIKNLEDTNRKISVEYSQEKDVLNLIISKRDEEIKKLKDISKETEIKMPKKEEVKKINIPKTFDNFERREIKSMIKIAMQYGDSRDKIKESLVNAGYNTEIVDDILG